MTNIFVENEERDEDMPIFFSRRPGSHYASSADNTVPLFPQATVSAQPPAEDQTEAEERKSA